MGGIRQGYWFMLHLTPCAAPNTICVWRNLLLRENQRHRGSNYWNVRDLWLSNTVFSKTFLVKK